MRGTRTSRLSQTVVFLLTDCQTVTTVNPQYPHINKVAWGEEETKKEKQNISHVSKVFFPPETPVWTSHITPHCATFTFKLVFLKIRMKEGRVKIIPHNEVSSVKEKPNSFT